VASIRIAECGDESVIWDAGDQALDLGAGPNEWLLYPLAVIDVRNALVTAHGVGIGRLAVDCETQVVRLG
jgi:hypothetical protein